ncbi:MAG TPA: hypothetical protein VFZ34_27985 [Blastocatellia bacterium]|nr:hypothetical protein [Blastocatellia bacterium]
MREEELLTIVRAQEDQIRAQQFEAAYFWDWQGTLLFRKEGEIKRITFSDEEIARMKGTVATHNHPHGWNFSASDPRRAGYGFSGKDVRLACLASLRLLRVVTPTLRYMIKPPPEGWDAAYWEQVIQPSYQRVIFEVRRELWAKVQARQILQARAEVQFRYLTWLRVAAELGLEYSQEDF